MQRSSLLGSRENSVPAAHDTDPGTRQISQARLRIGLPEPQDIAVELPEILLRWLHDGLDQHPRLAVSERRMREHQFETTIIARLFPIHDPRTFIIRLRDHSRATALTARVVAEHAAPGCSDQAFIVGWLHDMGLAACLRQLDPDLVSTEGNDFDRVWPGLRQKALDSAISLATAWRLPSPIRHAIREHIDFATLRSVHSIAAATFVAEHLAGCMGCGFRDEQPTSGLRAALATLQLSERNLVPMGRYAERLLAREAWYWIGPLPCAGA